MSKDKHTVRGTVTERNGYFSKIIADHAVIEFPTEWLPESCKELGSEIIITIKKDVCKKSIL